MYRAWMSSTCFLLASHRTISLIPARRAARIFSLMPPTGSTCPRSVISPVMARNFRTLRWVNTEALLDAVTALSGSGPAYFFMFMEAMAATGVRMGLDRETSAQLAMQTGLGAAQMAMQSDVDLLELRKRVCSPGGTTLKAVESFESASLAQTVDNAMQAALDRAIEMAKEMG